MSKRYRPDENHVYRTAPRAKRVRRDPTIALAVALQAGDKGSCLVAITPETRNLIWLALDMRARVQLSRTCRGLHREMKMSAWWKGLVRIGIKNLSPSWFHGGIAQVIDACAKLATAADLTLKYHWHVVTDGRAGCDLQIAWTASGLVDAYKLRRRLVGIPSRYDFLYRRFQVFYSPHLQTVQMYGGGNNDWSTFHDWLHAWLNVAEICRQKAGTAKH